MARPIVDLTDKIVEKVQQYADDNGLKMPRAYRELIQTGLQEKGCEADNQ